MLSKRNELKFISTPELMKIYAADEVYIRCFTVLDMAYYSALYDEKPLPKTAMPEVWMLIWYKKFTDRILIRFNPENYKNGTGDEKYTIYGEESGYPCEKFGFEIKFSKKFNRELLVIKNGETFDFLYNVRGGFSDLFGKERQLLTEKGVMGVPIYDELLPGPFFVLKIDCGVAAKDFEKYDLI